MTRYVVLLIAACLAGCGVPHAESGTVSEEAGQADAAVPSPGSAAVHPVELANTEQFPLVSEQVDQTFQIRIALPRG